MLIRRFATLAALMAVFGFAGAQPTGTPSAPDAGMVKTPPTKVDPKVIERPPPHVDSEMTVRPPPDAGAASKSPRTSTRAGPDREKRASTGKKASRQDDCREPAKLRTQGCMP
jgi:hypothetical protein